VQFNKEDNKFASPFQEANLNKKLPVICTWYNIRPSSTIIEDVGMQLTVWLQNDPINPTKYTHDNKLERINLHCIFEPSTHGLGGKRKSWRSVDGIDYISGIMVSKSGATKPAAPNVPSVNGNAPGNSLSSAPILLEKNKYIIKNLDPAHPFNQEIDIQDVPNYATFSDLQTNTLTAHPGYSQVNIIFLLNDENPGINKGNIWYGEQVFNDGDKLTCDVWLPDHYAVETHKQLRSQASYG
jgi:hypothetical protein